MPPIAKGRIKRALISVYDKTGVADFARALVDEFGVEIISTGGTAAMLKASGIMIVSALIMGGLLNLVLP